MRNLALLLLATPAAGWEASREGHICLLTHEMDDAVVIVSHDATSSVPYAIDLLRTDGWQSGPVFAIRFDGPRPLTITTDRHAVTGNTLSVKDTGFGNVLNGIAGNQVAIAMSGETALVIPLTGAAPEVEDFKACAANLST